MIIVFNNLVVCVHLWSMGYSFLNVNKHIVDSWHDLWRLATSEKYCLSKLSILDTVNIYILFNYFCTLAAEYTLHFKSTHSASYTFWSSLVAAYLAIVFWNWNSIYFRDTDNSNLADVSLFQVNATTSVLSKMYQF